MDEMWNDNLYPSVKIKNKIEKCVKAHILYSFIFTLMSNYFISTRWMSKFLIIMLYTRSVFYKATFSNYHYISRKKNVIHIETCLRQFFNIWYL